MAEITYRHGGASSADNTAPFGVDMPSTIVPGSRVENSTWQTINMCKYMRNTAKGTISKIATSITSPSGNISVGVYSNTGLQINAKPLTQKATSGAIACPAAGMIQEISLGATITIEAGEWFAMSCDNIDTSMPMVTGGGDIPILSAYAWRQSSAHPLPVNAAGGIIATGLKLPVLVGIA